jgi:ABC-type antimicrobial peptide transport system permease subunit
LCAMAGGIGLLTGFASYQVIIWGASKLVPKMAFEWVLNPFALIFSSVSILAVGLLSGYVPASRAEKLSPVEALRSE